MTVKNLFIALICLVMLFSCLSAAEQTSTEAARQVVLLPEEPEETVRPPEIIDPARQVNLDAHARKAPPELKQSLPALAAYLSGPCENDLEKARMIFVWISENIAYDTDAFFYGKTKPQTGTSVLTSGMAVCAGYSDIFKSLGDEMGIEVITINGHGKGYSYSEGSEIIQNHAWTAVRIDQRWVLIDSTWGAGYVGDDRKFHRNFTEYWFDVDPQIMIFTHLPSNSDYQFAEKIISKNDYSALPNLKPDIFADGVTVKLIHSIKDKYPRSSFTELLHLLPAFMDYGLSEEQFYSLSLKFTPDEITKLKWDFNRYLDLGFEADRIAGELLSEEYSGLFTIYEHHGNRIIEAVNLPLKAELKKGKTYTFEYIAEDTIRNALIYNGEWHFALKEGEQPYGFAGLYDGTIDENDVISFTLKCNVPGNIKLVTQPEEGDPFGGIIEYRIK